jgi:hypothetical protein
LIAAISIDYFRRFLRFTLPAIFFIFAIFFAMAFAIEFSPLILFSFRHFDIDMAIFGFHCRRHYATFALRFHFHYFIFIAAIKADTLLFILILIFHIRCHYLVFLLISAPPLLSATPLPLPAIILLDAEFALRFRLRDAARAAAR